MLSRTLFNGDVLHRGIAEMDRLFESMVGGPGVALMPRALSRSAFPALNFREEPEAYVAEAELPGFAPEHVQVSVTGSELTIAGKREFAVEENAQIIRRERAMGAFERTITLPGDVNADKVEATLRDGVLTVRLPKSEAARARKITVNGS